MNLRGAATATPFVLNIDYDAKGQRTRIDYGNGASTFYEYDPLTFRLIHLRTTRPGSPDDTASQLFSDATIVQDLSYTYDPVGNITRIEDSALRTVYYNSRQVDPIGRYTYDAVYRLIEAQGREHIGQSAFAFTPTGGNYRDYPFVGNTANPNDLQALRNYIERYEYDSVGNFEALRHAADAGGWTRTYAYEEESLLESSKMSNRLTGTTVGNGFTRTETYTHDAHGNMTSMPHLTNMSWDFEDQLQQVDLGGGGRAYYVYEAAGQRIRKVIESQSGVRQKERIYLGGFEIYREYSGNGAVSLVRESLHVMDDKQRIALVDTRTQGNDGSPQQLIRYQLGNHLGSASVELDNSGALISYEDYYPYGTTAFQAGRSASEVSLKRYRYTGKERDDETGFSYHGARYYAPWLGRWTKADPKGFVDGLNLYNYVRGNPINSTDPNGKDTKQQFQNKEKSQGQKGKPTIYDELWKQYKSLIKESANPDEKSKLRDLANASLTALADKNKMTVRQFINQYNTGDKSKLLLKLNENDILKSFSTDAFNRFIGIQAKSSFSQIAPDLQELRIDLAEKKIITLHHSGSQETPQDVESLHRGRKNNILRRIFGQTYNFADVGYNYMINKEGVIYEGRSLEYVPAHVLGHNPGNIGIAFLGNYEKNELSGKQLEVANRLVKYLTMRYDINDKEGKYLYTHGEFDTEKRDELSGAMKQINMMHGR